MYCTYVYMCIRVYVYMCIRIGIGICTHRYMSSGLVLPQHAIDWCCLKNAREGALKVAWEAAVLVGPGTTGGPGPPGALGCPGHAGRFTS